MTSCGVCETVENLAKSVDDDVYFGVCNYGAEPTRAEDSRVGRRTGRKEAFILSTGRSITAQHASLLSRPVPASELAPIEGRLTAGCCDAPGTCIGVA